jgi:RNA polymerase sigma factor (sigma-70 family)
MPSRRLTGLVDWLRRITATAAEADTADGQLVRRFVSERDGAAFEALVRRHGPLVWCVCRRLLAQEADAEDAFQATFLVLARKAGAISKGASVRSWLYGTALRVAARARAQAGRRSARERPLPETAAAGVAAAAEDRELRHVLDEEIGRLPAHERLTVILCDLEGKTHDEAARELGCPRGTVGARLSRARERLRRRLTGRGVTLSAGALAAALSQREALAVPAPLIRSTVEAVTAAGGGSAGAGAASPQATALAEGVIQAMNLSKRRMLAALLLAALTIGGGAAVLAYGARPSEPRQDPGAGQKAGNKGPPSVADLARERLQAAREVHDGLLRQVRQGTINGAEIATWSPHLLAAELDVAATPAERRAALQAHVERLKENERLIKAYVDAGRSPAHELARARCLRLEAELLLAKAKAK